MDPKEIVAQGYDQIAARYAEWAPSVRVEERAHYTNVLLESLPESAEILELGCGSGLPTTRRLAERFHSHRSGHLRTANRTRQAAST